MGRPSVKEPKSIQKRVRISEEDDVKISKNYKSFTDFVRASIKALPMAAIFLLQSCGNSGGGLGVGGATVGEFDLYSLSDPARKQETIAYSLHMDCDGHKCEATGEISGYDASGALINEVSLSYQELLYTSLGTYTARICNAANDCFDLKLQPDANYLKISKGALCRESGMSASKDQYNFYALSNGMNGAPINFSANCEL